MSQHDYNIANSDGATVRSDINDVLAAIVTWNSGASDPATTFARMRAVNTTAGVVKRRNAANSGWIVIGTDDETLVLSRSSNTILDVSDFGKTIVATSTFTQTLDAAATLGDGWFCSYRVESGATITFDPNSTENIDGATTKAVTGPSSGLIFCNGSNFFTVGFVATSLTTTVPRLLENLGLAVTMAANAVTIALKGADGNDPSASNLVGIGFRHATLTNGQASKVQVSAAASVAISSGSTGGSVSAEASRVWIAAINNAGTVELAWSIRRSGTSVLPIDEGNVISTTAEGGAGAADTAGVWYSTTARSNVPFTILGYFDSTQATAGTWATSATSVVVNPEYRPGDVVQVQRNVTGAVATGTTTLPNDDTVPQNTEGDQYMTQAITPTSASNLLRISARAHLTNSATNSMAAALFQDTTAGALAVGASRPSAAGNIVQVDVDHNMLAATTSSTTMKVRAGGTAAGTTTFNGEGGARFYGGVLASFMEIAEVAA
jgi:hypothetical protein